MAAHAELLATQIKDEAALGPVDEEALNSTFGDGSNQWRSSNTSSSSQTHAAIQRMTRLDTAAWQIAYKELKFSRQIGEGSFGRVFLGKWRETTVAIKLLNPTMRKACHGSDSDDGERNSHQINSCKPGLLDDLDKEAGIMAALRHPNVVMFLGVCLEPPCMVAEFCARGSLHDVLTRASRSKTLQQQLDWVRRINMALDAAKGMLYLHMCQPPILHRDLKSANLLVSKHWKVKVSDFNLSRVMEASSMASSIAATNPRWVAPEVLAGSHYGKAADVYAFGVILWEILTWQVPWDDLGPWQVVIEVVDRKARPEMPPLDKLPGGELCLHDEYIELMEDCWAQDPLARPSFEAVIARLRWTHSP
ncbi:MAG: PAS domain-containing tyrosine kinase [Trebouxia sp. A1-2]|nr:MAG: PAS domain-containing tyrosine kinase [Trebouxia sp. A1-2]